jgi:hypothetical protein
MLLTSVATIRTDFSVRAFMAIQMFLFMTHARTKSTFLLHREFEPQRHLGWGGGTADRRGEGKGRGGCGVNLNETSNGYMATLVLE